MILLGGYTHDDLKRLNLEQKLLSETHEDYATMRIKPKKGAKFKSEKVCVCMCMSVCVRVLVSVCVCVCVFLNVSSCMCTGVYRYVCIHVCEFPKHQ